MSDTVMRHMGRPPRVGYCPYNETLLAPGDRRRFVAYAKSRKIDFEIATPGKIYDLVVLSELADITCWAEYSGAKIVYDLIDSYLATGGFLKDKFRGSFKYLKGTHRKFEFDFRESVRKMCRRADAVICSTQEQKAMISQYCANVHVILDVQTTTARLVKTDYRRHRNFKIAWEGLASNLIQLRTISAALDALSGGHSLELHIVTDPTMPRFLGQIGQIETSQFAKTIFKNAVVHPWLEESCARIITDCDMAVIPVDLSDPFAAGKPENKLLLLWRMGLPVVTSTTPAYQRAMRAAGLDDVCRNPAQWTAAIQRMMDSEKQRADAATKGHHYACSSFPEPHIYALWDAAFSSCGFHFGPQAGDKA